MDLGPFKTEALKFYFYFPEVGEFEHYPTNAFMEDVITTVSEIKTLEVKKKQVITKVNTFRDLMMLCKTDEEKKNKILHLLTENFHLTHDKKYQFDWDSIQYIMDNDSEFFFKVSQIYYGHFDDYPELRFKLTCDLIKDPKHVADRSALFE